MSTIIDYSQIDEASLDAWLSGRLPAYRGHPRLTLISGGQSTPTYRLQSGDRAWVLRKRPPGDWPRYVFPIDREYAVLRALGDSAVPVPRAHLLTPNLPEAEPLPGEVSDEGVAFGIEEYAIHLSGEDIRLGKLFRIGQCHEFFVGHRRPEKIREARGEFVGC